MVAGGSTTKAPPTSLSCSRYGSLAGELRSPCRCGHRWSPPELTADLIEFLESGALDALSGRYIHARNDDWRGMTDRIPEILERDLHALRVVQD